MVVDTSALVAILLREKERFIFENLVLNAPTVVMSVVSVVETTIVLIAQRQNPEAEMLDEILRQLRIDIRGVDTMQGTLARNAFQRFGRRQSPAALNFGDCFAYALAKATGESLLFIGADFAHTDITPAAIV